jgi:hypothetical protein
MVAAAGGGDTFTNDGASTYFLVENADATATTVTFDGTGTAPTSAVAFDDDVATSVPAADIYLFGPFPKDRFTATVSVTYSKVTSLTVVAFNG